MTDCKRYLMWLISASRRCFGTLVVLGSNKGTGGLRGRERVRASADGWFIIPLFHWSPHLPATQNSFSFDLNVTERWILTRSITLSYRNASGKVKFHPAISQTISWSFDATCFNTCDLRPYDLPNVLCCSEKNRNLQTVAKHSWGEHKNQKMIFFLLLMYFGRDNESKIRLLDVRSKTVQFAVCDIFTDVFSISWDRSRNTTVSKLAQFDSERW